MIRKGIYAFILITVVISIYGQSRQSTSVEKATTQQEREILWIEKNKEVVKQKLKDPGSATFEHTRVMYIADANKTPIVCGEVNSKNSYGGYTGNKKFISAGSALFHMEGEDGFDNVWVDLCF